MNMQDLIKELRSITGAGLSLCKKALEATAGSVAEGVDWLRKQGHAQASKLAGRETGEGLIAMHTGPNCGVLVHLGCETDFVAGNDQFGQLASDLAKTACHLKLNSREELEAKTLEEVQNVITTIKENIILKDYVRLEGNVVGYVYRTTMNGVADIGKKGCLISFKGEDRDAVREIAMHVIAHDTKYMLADQIPAEFIAKEKDILTERMKSEGKPDTAIEKILQGLENKLRTELALVNQPFFKNDKISISQFCKEKGIELVDFKVMSL